MKKFKFLKFICCIILFTSMIFQFTVTTQAATDKKRPTIKLVLSTKEVTNGNVKITIKATDASGIKAVKWASNKKTTKYFKKSGKTLALNSKNKATVTIKKNGTYTFYAIDKAGNTKNTRITVSNIDKTAPIISLTSSNTDPTNKEIKINIQVKDQDSNIKELKYILGSKTIKDVQNAGTLLSLSKKNEASVTVSENGTLTFLVEDVAGNQTLSSILITNIDKISPQLEPTYSVMNQKATVTINGNDADSGIGTITYLKGTLTDINSEKWTTKGKNVIDLSTFVVNKAGNYSILVEDKAGNKTVTKIKIVMEMQAVWISYLEFSKSGYTESAFKNHINTMFDNCVKWNMNTVIVQVRPFGDALYKSSYFPWSEYVSGTQGEDPGYDPLQIMIDAAHERKLEIHAWLNPYRITVTGTNIKTLSEDNRARKWRESSDNKKNRNVLTYDGRLYYNPSKSDVQSLIVNGVKEIVNNYDIDGIHFDDYFYPTLDSKKYTSQFDATEYKEYVLKCKEKDTTAKNIVKWRRSNVNILVKKVYSSIKKIDPTVQFGISPAGNIDNLLAPNKYYVDINTWLKSSSYVDYICPQIYWTFQHASYPYDKTLDRWLSIRTSDTVHMYVGIPLYKAGSNLEDEFKNSSDVMKRMIKYGRNTTLVDGYFYFRYAYFQNKTTAKEVENLLPILK